MQFIGTLLTNIPYFGPIPFAGWLVWLGLLGLLSYVLLSWRRFQPRWQKRNWGLFVVLFLVVPITSLFLGLQISAGSALPVPGLPAESLGSNMMLLSALPWMLGGGLLGPVGAAALGLFSGFLRGMWDTHSLFSALDLGLMGALFAVSIGQRYRTPFYRLLRQPLASALGLIIINIVLFTIRAFFTAPSATAAAERLDYALSNIGVSTLTFGGEVMIAGIAAQVIAMAYPLHWGNLGKLVPSPAEESIETRFAFGTGTVISLLLLTLLVGDWVIAGAAARNMLKDRLASTAQMAAQSVPIFLETGQNLASQFSEDPRLANAEEPVLSSILAEHIQSVPFFDQMALLNFQTSTLLSLYPADGPFQLSAQEEAGLPLIPQGVPNQMYTILPVETGGTARVSFFAAVPGTSRVLIGRTGLNTNPLMRTLVSSLDSLRESDGAGLLIDDQGNILYRSQAAQIMTAWSGGQSSQPSFYNETASNGTRQLVYYQPVPGHPWAVVLTIPAQRAQQLAINIALPLSVMIVLLGLVALASLRIGLRAVTGSLKNLAVEAKHIAQGKLDRPLATGGTDEVGDLSAAFEQMRVSLQARMDELNRLLIASQGAASSLTMQDALQPVLEALVANGASSARVVLARDVLPNLAVEAASRFAQGPEQNAYAYLDQQILSLAEQQGQIVMANLTRTRGLILDPNLPQPASLLAVALHHENRYYGALWAAYSKQRAFTDSDIRFIGTLASQVALALANIRLFTTVEVSRRQLEAILNSTPDPVLVIDASNRLILANPAARQVFGMTVHRGERPDLESAIPVKALLELLQSPPDERRSAEISMPDGKTYLATTSAMTAEGRTMGRICILRDVTQLKEIDTLKSDFVSTVSHDLRSPLTLMRGYATMLQMAGDLNDQQKNYVRMIVTGVDNMSKLVSNLLDLGRIEFGVGLQVESVPVLDLLERVTNSLQIHSTQKHIEFGVEIPKDLPNVIEADQALLYQAVYNLVENAIKYTPEGGRVTVHLQTSPTALTFAVQDSGIGIPNTDLPRLFEKFYRGTHRAALTQRGTGLGLAIVKSIAERHGGRVWAESELGKGSTFYLQIPLVQPKDRTGKV